MVFFFLRFLPSFAHHTRDGDTDNTWLDCCGNKCEYVAGIYPKRSGDERGVGRVRTWGEADAPAAAAAAKVYQLFFYPPYARPRLAAVSTWNATRVTRPLNLDPTEIENPGSALYLLDIAVNVKQLACIGATRLEFRGCCSNG